MTQLRLIKSSTGKGVNPRPRAAPLCYSHAAASDGARDVLDDERTHEIFMIFLAFFATLSFASLCVAIA